MTCSCSCCPKWLCGVALVALLGLTVASLGWAPNSGGAGGAAKDDKKPAAPGEVKGDPYTLDVCVVCGDKLGAKGDFVSYDYEGRDMRFCCSECLEKFKAAPAKFIAKVDEEMIKQQMPFYPLTTCVVQPNHTLDSKDKAEAHHNGAVKHDDDDEDEAPVNMIYKNRLVRFCCDDCPKEFLKNPAQYLKKLDEAVIAKQTPTYAMTTCPVSGEKLGAMGEPVTKVIGNRMVMLCCKGCIKELRRDPAAVFAKLDAAEKDKKTAP